MRIPGSVASVILLSACAAEAAEQKYSIKLKTYPEAGKTVTVRDTDKDTGSVKFFDPDGKLVNEVKPKIREKVYSITVLARKKSDAPAEKFTRVYEKATETENGKSKTLSYQGRTVVFELKEGKYWVGVVGKPPLDEKDLDEFIEKANHYPSGDADFDKAMMPAKPVTVGDRWTADPKPFEDVLRDIGPDRLHGHLHRLRPARPQA
jgi:hypothetical protein